MTPALMEAVQAEWERQYRQAAIDRLSGSPIFALMLAVDPHAAEALILREMAILAQSN